MDISALTSGNNPAQAVQQARPDDVRQVESRKAVEQATRTEEANKRQQAEQAQREQQAQQNQQSKPVVNTQGQVTGQVVNIVA